MSKKIKYLKFVFIFFVVHAFEVMAFNLEKNLNYQQEIGNEINTNIQDDWYLILERYLVKNAIEGVNLFNYAKLAENFEDQILLDNYLSKLKSVDPILLSRNDAIAFYANLYNATVVRIVIKNYPIKSIRKLGPFNSGPWKRKIIKLNGELVSLDDIEHKILRSQYLSPYIHYMLNCASISCPNLQATPWKADSLEADQLTAATEYINSSRAVTLKKNGLRLSSIYKWFKEDFENDGGVLDHILKHANKDLKNAIKKGVKIKSYNYDWTLNDVTDN